MFDNVKINLNNLEPEDEPISLVDGRIPIGTYMLIWFINPDKITDERGLCTQYYRSFEKAKAHAALFSGPRIILIATAQNPNPENMIFWSLVKRYGDSFDLSELTILPEEYRRHFENESRGKA